MNKIEKISIKDYKGFLNDVLTAIQDARNNVARVVTHVTTGLYWEIGKMIIEKQSTYGWGNSVVEQLSKDLQLHFDDTVSWSPRNLWLMKQMYEDYSYYISLIDNQKNKKLKQPVSELKRLKKLEKYIPDITNLKQLVSEIPWGQNILILQKIKTIEERIYYLKATAGNRWSRSVLLNQIKAGAYQIYLKNPKKHNFNQALPAHIAEQADEALKSEYNLGFLGITKPVLERQLENLMVENVKKLILELGYGFCFIGNQYKLSLGKKDYYVDLLFFHRKLRCLVAIELKTTEFKPEYAGKLDFYLSLLDEQVKIDEENPAVGIILCAEKDNLEVEYTLKISKKPIGVAEYKLTKNLPKELKGQLPSAKELTEKAKFLFK